MKIKTLTSIILVIMILFCIASISVAAPSYQLNPSDYKPADLTTSDYQSAMDKTKTIVTGITSVGIVVSVVSTLVLGIRYMAASVEKRADYKKSMIPMVIGMVLLFSVCTIISIIFGIMKDFNT